MQRGKNCSLTLILTLTSICGMLQITATSIRRIRASTTSPEFITARPRTSWRRRLRRHHRPASPSHPGRRITSDRRSRRSSATTSHHVSCRLSSHPVDAAAAAALNKHVYDACAVFALHPARPSSLYTLPLCDCCECMLLLRVPKDYCLCLSVKVKVKVNVDLFSASSWTYL